MFLGVCNQQLNILHIIISSRYVSHSISLILFLFCYVHTYILGPTRRRGRATKAYRNSFPPPLSRYWSVCSFSTIPYYPIFNPILSYPILSYPILSYPILSYPILSYPILSYPILSYPIPSLLLFLPVVVSLPSISSLPFCSILLSPIRIAQNTDPYCEWIWVSSMALPIRNSSPIFRLWLWISSTMR